MSTSSSIFQKACPACASSVSLSAEQCRCGHRFESDHPSTADDILRDEELYESYLAARLEQTRQAMVAAFETHNADPGNAEKNAALELSRNVAMDVENDLRAQREKIAALRNRRVPPASSPKPAPATVPSSLASPANRGTPVATKHVPRHSTTPAPAAVDTHATAAASRVAGVLSALKDAKARETAKARPGTTPPSQFRQEQGARAEKVMESLTSEGTQNCPNCTATLPANSARCGCGYTFHAAGASNIPSLTLGTSDFTALRTSFLKDQNRRR